VLIGQISQITRGICTIFSNLMSKGQGPDNWAPRHPHPHIQGRGAAASTQACPSPHAPLSRTLSPSSRRQGRAASHPYTAFRGLSNFHHLCNGWAPYLNPGQRGSRGCSGSSSDGPPARTSVNVLACQQWRWPACAHLHELHWPASAHLRELFGLPARTCVNFLACQRAPV